MAATALLCPETSGGNGLGQLPQPARSRDGVRDISNLDAVGGRELGLKAVCHRSKASLSTSTRQANQDAHNQSRSQVLRWRMSSGHLVSTFRWITVHPVTGRSRRRPSGNTLVFVSSQVGFPII